MRRVDCTSCALTSALIKIPQVWMQCRMTCAAESSPNVTLMAGQKCMVCVCLMLGPERGETTGVVIGSLHVKGETVETSCYDISVSNSTREFSTVNVACS